MWLLSTISGPSSTIINIFSQVTRERQPRHALAWVYLERHSRMPCFVEISMALVASGMFTTFWCRLVLFARPSEEFYIDMSGALLHLVFWY